MPVINRSSQSIVASVSGGNFQPLSLDNATFTAGDWNGTTPTNLQAIADGDSGTGTGWGRTEGGGNQGWIQADLGTFYPRLYVEIEAGIKMHSSWAGGHADWFLHSSEIVTAFAPVWQVSQFRATDMERILYLNLFVSCRYLRLGCLDNGSGQGMLKWYGLKVWQLFI